MKRTENTPWVAFDLMTNENLGWFESEAAAVMATRGKPVTIQYRPKRKR